MAGGLTMRQEGPAIRAKCRIETADWTYDAAQIECMRHEDEGAV